MFSVFTFACRPLGRFWLAAPLAAALALGHFSAQAQVAPTPAPAEKSASRNSIYYVDGQLATTDQLGKIDPGSISSINVIKGASQQQLFGSTTADGVVVITTKAQASSPAVLAFNKRISDVVPLTPATPAQQASLAAAQAYLAQHYPQAKVESVLMAPGKPGRYQAIFTEGGQRRLLLFDGQGRPVQQ